MQNPMLTQLQKKHILNSLQCKVFKYNKKIFWAITITIDAFIFFDFFFVFFVF